MKTGKFLLGIVSGAAAGAVVGMLFAPKKGTETRQRIADKSNDYIKGTKNRFNEVTDTVSAKLDHLKDCTVKKAKKAESEIKKEGDKIVY